VTLDLSPSPLPSSSTDADADADAAAQQLLAEARSPARHPPVSSAVLGASLLNAARIDHRHGSPADMVRKNGAGKLRRVTIVPDGPRQDLARRKNLYDIELSPEKGNYTLPAKVNHKPLKLVRKKKEAEEARSDVPVLSSELPGADVNDLLLDQAEQEPAEVNVDQEHIPENGTTTQYIRVATQETPNGARCSNHAAASGPRQKAHTDPVRRNMPETTNDDQAAPQKTSKRKSGSDHNDKRPSKLQRSQRPKANGFLQPAKSQPQVRAPARRSSEHQTAEEATRDENDVRSQEDDVLGSAQKGMSDPAPIENQTRSRRQAEKKQPAHQQQRTMKRKGTRVKSPAKQAAVDEAPIQEYDGEGSDAEAQDPDTGQEQESDPAPAGRRTGSRKQATDNDPSAHQAQPSRKSKAKKATRRSKDVMAEEAPLESEDEESDARSIRRQPITNERSNKVSKRLKQAAAEEPPVNEPEEEEPDTEAQDSDPEEDEDTESLVSTLGTIDGVFKFLDREKRPGKCQTELGTTIRRICKRSCVQLQDEDVDEDKDVSMATAMEDFEDIRQTLGQIGSSIEDSDRRAFKGDAYVHIFRALTQYLKVLYERLLGKYGTVTESLNAMRVLFSLTHEILAFKAAIAKWKVSIPQRYKGDRIVKDVDSGLIAPLQQVHKHFAVRLSQLEAAERSRMQNQKYRRKMEEREEEEERRTGVAEVRKERWKHWQELHIARMQCEPDVNRRQKLAITRFEVLEDKDANGVTFERLAVFKSRSTPPQHRTSALAQERKWTDNQESALLNGLREFAGKSHAFRVGYT
jgi:hypothetical protein